MIIEPGSGFGSGATALLVVDVQRGFSSRRVGEVHVCGVDTDACVLLTTVDLFENGFRAVVLSGACASSGGDEFHRAWLFLLRRQIGGGQIR